MDEPINLATLPKDIIRRIIRLDGVDDFNYQERLLNFGLISHSWRDCVQELKKPPLERLYLFKTSQCRLLERHVKHSLAIGESKAFLGLNFKGELESDQVPEDPFHMLATIPKQFMYRVSNCSWLAIARNGLDPDNAFEAIRLPLLVVSLADMLRRLRHWAPHVVVGVVAMIAMLAMKDDMPPFKMVFVVFSGFFFGGRLLAHNTEAEMMRQRAAGLCAFIASFSHVETLRLGNMAHRDDACRTAVDNLLEGVECQRLEVFEQNMSTDLRDHILHLCRNNGIRHLFVGSIVWWNIDIVNFIREVCSLGVTFDIYVMGVSNVNEIFLGETRAEWAKYAEKLKKDGISLRMVTSDGNSFPLEIGGSYYVLQASAHIRCEQIDGSTEEPLVPLKIARGSEEPSIAYLTANYSFPSR